MIIKSKQFNKFAIVNGDVLRDKKISLRAKGLFAILSSLPPDWVIHKSQLHQFSHDGRDSTIKTFNELISANIVFQIEKLAIGKNGGLIKTYDYIVYPEPQLTMPVEVSELLTLPENQLTVTTRTEDQALINKGSKLREHNKDNKPHTQAVVSSFSNKEQIDSQKEKSSTPPNRENGKPSVKDGIVKRKNRLWAEIIEASKNNGGIDGLTQEIAEGFHEHFTQVAGDNLNLMMFEAQRFWNTTTRLKKWIKHEKPTDEY